METPLLLGTFGNPAGARPSTGTRTFLRRLLAVASLGLLGTGVAQAQSTITIGTTTQPSGGASSNNTFYGPIYRFSAPSTNNRSRYAYLYTAAELGIPSGSTITGIEWLKSDGNTAAGANTFNVLLKSTTATALSAGTTGTTWAALIAGATSSYSSTTQAVTGGIGSYFGVTFTTNFAYTSGNLIVMADWIRGGTTTNFLGWVPNAATGMGIGAINSSTTTSPADLSDATRSGQRPTVRITFTAPPCTGTPAGGTAVASVASSCATTASNLSVTGDTQANGLTYQWQQSSTGVTSPNSFTNIIGATSSTYAATGVASTTYYRRSITCTASAVTSLSSVAVVAINPTVPTTYAALPITEDFDNTWTGACGNREVPTAIWRANPLTGNNSWRREDDGFASAGWRYPADETGATPPYPTRSSNGLHSARFHTFGADGSTVPADGVGEMYLYVNLVASGTEQLSFDYINPTATSPTAGDKLEISLSTDAGMTYTVLQTLTTSATFAGQTIVLPNGTATSVIRFRATSDYGNDDIGIDKLRVQSVACPPVTALTSANVSQTMAKLNFIPASGAVDYEVTYTPQGGSTTTLPTNPTGSGVNLTGLTPGTAYTATVATNCGAGSSATAASTSFNTLIGNDECSGAVSLTPGAPGAACAAINGLNIGATSSGVSSVCTAGTAPFNDVWYSFTATNTRHLITVTGGFGFAPAIDLRTGACPGTSVLCGAANTTFTLSASGLNVGQLYYVRLYDAATVIQSNNFTICVTTPSAATCAQAMGFATTNVGSTTVQLGFTPLATGATNYTLTVRNTATGVVFTTGTVAGSPVSLSGLTPSTGYTALLETNCTNDGVSAPVTITFTTTAPVAAPANDNPTGAVALALGSTCTPTSTTTLGATLTTINGYTNPGTSCGIAGSPRDVWYKFTTAASGNGSQIVEVTVAGTVAGRVRAFSAASSAGPFTSINCAAGTTNDTQAPVLTLTGLTPSTTYYLAVSGYGSADAQGSFTVCVVGASADLVVSAATPIRGTYNNVTVVSGGAATLSGDLTVNGTLTVQDGGSLAGDLVFFIQGPGQVVIQPGATFIEPNTAGLTNTGGAGSFLLSGTNPISFSTNANYVFNGSSAQVTGTLAPTTMRSLTVNNAAGLTLSAATGVSQLVKLTNGSLASGGRLTLLSSATGTALVVNAGSGTVTGSTAMQRYIDPSRNAGMGYRHFSAPVAAQPFSGLAAGSFTPNLNTAYNASLDPYNTPSFPNVFEYDESRVNTVTNAIPDAFSKGWKVPTTANLAVGKGYDVSISAADKVTFNGTLNNGTLPVALTRTGGVNGGWQLVGNPYPAPLDIANIGAADRTGLDAAFYIFRSTTQYNGLYDSYVNGIGALVAASSQGFFCRVSAGQTAGTLTFRNAQRQTGFNDVNPRFQRGVVDTRPQLRLTLASAAAPAATDQAYVYLQTGASTGFDTEFDAAKMANPTGLNLAALAGTEPVAINGLPLLTAATLVPLTVGLPAAGSYVLTAADFANFGGTAVVLRDALLGTRTPLTAGTAYRFTAAGTTANGRFTLELNPSAAPLATAAQALAALVQVYPNPAHGTFHLTLPASAKAATVQVVNALGQVVITRSLTSAEADFSTAKLAAGVYTLRLVVDGASVARKLTVE